MENNSKNLFEFFKTPLPYFLLIGSLTISPLLLSFEAFRTSIYDLDGGITNHLRKKVATEGEKFEFGCSHCGTFSNPTETILITFVLVLGLFFVLPSTLVSIVFIKFFEFILPSTHPTTMSEIAQISFVYFNTNYWIILSYLLYSYHDRIRSGRLQTIFSTPANN